MDPPTYLTRTAGWMVGLTAAALGSALGMVVVRCRVEIPKIYKCGDWSLYGLSWHFLPLFCVALGLWAALGLAIRSRRRVAFADAMAVIGLACAPSLGLVVGWTWYGITADTLHPRGGCDTPVICHDVLDGSIWVWTTPWLIWTAVTVTRVVRRSP